MKNLDFLTSFNEDACYTAVGSVEHINVLDNQINYNSANQNICATSG